MNGSTKFPGKCLAGLFIDGSAFAGVGYMHKSMIDIIVCSFLCYFAISDFYTQEIPNRWIIAAAIVLAPVAGIRFILQFSLAMVVAAFLPRVIGGGDLKLLCLLVGVYGISRTLVILLIGCSICLMMNFRKRLSTQIAMAPYLLGGFVCVELFQL